MVIAVCSFALALDLERAARRHGHRLGRADAAAGARGRGLPRQRARRGRRLARRGRALRQRDRPLRRARRRLPRRRSTTCAAARPTAAARSPCSPCARCAGRSTRGSSRVLLSATINGEARSVDGVWEGESLLYVLRERLGLPGSKNACEQGECGSCSIYLDGVLVCSCLVLAAQAEGREIVTVEGISRRRRPAPRPVGLPRRRRRPVRLLHPGTDPDDPRPAGTGARPDRPRDPRGARRQPLPLHGLREDHGRGAARRRAHGGDVTGRIVIEGCAIATVDADGSEHASGHIVIDDGVIVAIGEGRAPAGETGRTIEGEGLLATPGSRQLPPPPVPVGDARLRAGRGPVPLARRPVPALGARGRRRAVGGGDRRPRRARCSRAARRRPTTTTSSRATAATCSPSRSTPRSGSASASTRAAARWISGRSQGGLPPDEVVEDRDSILEATSQAIDRYHDTSPGAMTRIAVAPCSPFSVTEALMTESAALARRRGVRLHTHLAETIDEEQFCQERFGCRPVEYLERLDWLGDDVWLAHCVHIDGERGGALRRDAHRRRPLPELERASRDGHRAGRRPRARRRGTSVSASTAPPRTRPASSGASCARRCCSPGCGTEPPP